MNGESSERSSSMSDRPVPNKQHRKSHSLKDPPPCWWQEQIDFAILVPKMTKGHDNFRLMIPPGSLFDPDDVNRLPSPTTPFAFPFNPTSDQALNGMLADLPYMPTAMDSVTHMVGLPRVCGLPTTHQLLLQCVCPVRVGTQPWWIREPTSALRVCWRL
jgi:hypothetical protein